MLEVMTRRYYRLRTWRTSGRSLLDGRPPSPATSSSRGAAAAPDLDDGAGPTTCPARWPRWRRWSPRRADPPARVVDIYLAWPDRPADADELSTALREQLTAFDVAAGRRGGSPSTVCDPGRRRSSSSPSGPIGRRAGRGAGHPRHAPADRSAAGPVAAEELRRHPAAVGRGHLPVPPRRQGATRPTSGSSRWPRCATSPRCATPTARSSASRRPSGCWPRAWTASGGRRRARRPAAARQQPVFLHVWPPIEVPLSRAGALRADRARR